MDAISINELHNSADADKSALLPSKVGLYKRSQILQQSSYSFPLICYSFSKMIYYS